MATALRRTEQTVQNAILRATRWRKQEFDAAKSLGLECHPIFHKIAKEVASLREAKLEFAAAYEDAVHRFLEKEARACVERCGSISLFEEVPAQGRHAIYDKMKIECVPLDENQTKIFKVKNLYVFDALFNMIVHGSAVEKIKEMEGMQRPSIRISRLWGSSGAYCVGLEENGRKAMYFLKDGSMVPDHFGTKLLALAGILTPEITNVSYKIPFTGDSEYGISRNIAAEEGVTRAVSLRALARDEKLEPIISSEAKETLHLLGYSSEVFRLTGSQDKHARNIGVAQMDNKEKNACAIDLDITAVYPDTPLLQDSCARALNDNIKSLLFAYEHGEFVRERPGLIRAILDTEFPGCDSQTIKIKRERKRADFLKNGFVTFIEGADQARALFDSPEATKCVYELFREHDGKPVGWKQSPGELSNCDSGSPRTHNLINGQRQPLIESGPNCGRFVFRWEGAFKSFITQLSIKSKDFWHDVFDMAPAKTDHAFAY